MILDGVTHWLLAKGTLVIWISSRLAGWQGLMGFLVYASRSSSNRGLMGYSVGRCYGVKTSSNFQEPFRITEIIFGETVHKL